MAQAIVPPICDRVIEPILKEQREFHAKILSSVDVCNEKIGGCCERLDNIEKVVQVKRFDLKPSTQQIHIAVTEAFSSCRCPCCKEQIIIKDGEKLPELRFDHFYSKTKRHLKETWAVCSRCNMKLENPEFRADKFSDFMAYQNWVLIYQKESVQLAPPPPQGKLF